MATAKLQPNLPPLDLIVGTEEELRIAGGSTDTVAALRAVRAIAGAMLDCKRGPMGSAVLEGADPERSRPVRSGSPRRPRR